MTANVTLSCAMDDLNDTDNKELLNDFHGERTGFLQVGPSKYLLPVKYRNYAEEIVNFELREDDIWIMTHPRSGTTLTQELLWLISHDCDFETAKTVPLVTHRSPYLEHVMSIHDGVLSDMLQLVKGDEEKEKKTKYFGRNNIPILNEMQSPRVVKTHLLFSLLNPKLLDTCKVVYVARNPKDVAVSYYHLSRTLSMFEFVGDFPKFWDYFQRGLTIWGPYWEHLREAWRYKDHKNMLFMYYEELINDMKGSIRKVAKHLEKALTENQIQDLANYLHIDNFRKYVDVLDVPGVKVQGEHAFIRKGMNQGWKDYFTPEMNAKADEWIKSNLDKIPGLVFP